jgi:hypothetical protein
MDCQDKTEEKRFCAQYEACRQIPGWSVDGQSATLTPTIMATLEPTLAPSVQNGSSTTQYPTGKTFEPTISAMPTNADFGQISKYLPPLPANLTDLCNAIGASVDDGDDFYYKCDTSCMNAECCSLPEKFPQSCLGSQTELCLEYSLACASLDANTTHNNIELKIQNHSLENSSLGDVCSAESISYTFGLKECRRRCKPAQCCWQKNGARCNDPRCNVYAPCLNLVAMYTVGDSIIETVQTACRRSMIASVQGRAICESVCLQHSCCYDASCVVHDATVCDQYDGCKALFESGTRFNTTVGHATLPAPTNLQDICDENFMDGQTFYENCAAVCSAAECCNYPANMEISCLKGNEKK